MLERSRDVFPLPFLKMSAHLRSNAKSTRRRVRRNRALRAIGLANAAISALNTLYRAPGPVRARAPRVASCAEVAGSPGMRVTDYIYKCSLHYIRSHDDAAGEPETTDNNDDAMSDRKGVPKADSIARYQIRPDAAGH